MNNHFKKSLLFLSLLAPLQFVNAESLTQAQLYWDETSSETADTLVISETKPWAVYSQTVDTSNLSTGFHTLNLAVQDSESELSAIYKMNINVIPLANYDLAGQSNVIVTTSMDRSSRGITDSLLSVNGFGQSADGQVWSIATADTKFEGADIGQQYLSLHSSDAFDDVTEPFKLQLVVTEALLAGSPTVSYIDVELNTSLLQESVRTVNGPIYIAEFTSPSSLNSLNSSQLTTADWLGNSITLGESYFAFYDGDTDFIDDRFDPDLDNDGLTNDEEIALGTDPSDSDSDDDGVSDSIEVANNMDPLNGEDIHYDADEDGLTNAEELALGTGVNNPDTDSDGINDGLEVLYGLNPSNGNDAALDKDGDGVSNLDEILAGTLPNNPDSDDDGISDGIEIALGLDPLDSSDALADNDGDGISNIDEIALGTDINNLDSDGDGINDGVELANGSDPLDENSFVGSQLTLIAFDDVNNDGISDWLGYE
ncbi:thrombospondin type 3 repeat-containing protein, partial [Shewanella benthica]|nr:thrombospondin type 3 repeat-containing protein [Shewanella benthica]